MGIDIILIPYRLSRDQSGYDRFDDPSLLPLRLYYRPTDLARMIHQSSRAALGHNFERLELWAVVQVIGLIPHNTHFSPGRMHRQSSRPL